MDTDGAKGSVHNVEDHTIPKPKPVCGLLGLFSELVSDLEDAKPWGVLLGGTQR